MGLRLGISSAPEHDLGSGARAPRPLRRAARRLGRRSGAAAAAAVLLAGALASLLGAQAIAGASA
ncbi:MAG TPA: hypothetical protein VL977_01555, partial [Solirubrobacteraceae bacterium]|nr:hypothetical protein [Solirubrobacteraceae bacterium]